VKKLLLLHTNKSLPNIRDEIVVSLNPLCPGKSIENYDYDLSVVRRDAWKLVHEWPAKKFSGKTLDNHLKLGDFSMWYANKIPIFIILCKVLTLAIKIRSVMEKEKPDEVIVQDEFEPYYVESNRDFVVPVADAICNAMGIRLRTYTVPGNNLRRLKHRLVAIGLDMLTEFRTLQRKNFSSLSRPNILFFHYGVSNLAVTDRLSNELESTAHVCSDGVMKNRLHDIMQQNHHNYTYLEPYLTGHMKLLALHHAKTARKSLQRVLKNPKFASTFAYQGISLDGIMIWAIEQIIVENYFENSMTYLAMDALLKKVRPKVGFLAEDQLFYGYAAAHAMRKNNVLSITLAHGPLACEYESSVISADYIFVWSQIEKSSMVKRGIPSRRIHVAGTDTYNLLLRRYSGKSQQLAKELGAGKNRILTFAAKDPVLRDFTKISKLADLTKDIKNLKLIIKLHPADVSISTEKLKELFPFQNIIFLRATPFYALLRVSDLVITNQMCRTGIDAIVFSVPLVIWDPPDNMNEDSSSKVTYESSLKPYIKVEGDKMATELIEKMLDNVKQKKKFRIMSKRYYEKYYSGLDVNHIKKFLKKHHRL